MVFYNYETRGRKGKRLLKRSPYGGPFYGVKNWGAMGSAVIFAYDDDLNFFFMTRSNTLKYKNIEANPIVALTVADEKLQITVQAVGTISRVAAKDYMDVVFKKLAKVKPHDDYQWMPPVIKVHNGDYMILQITPFKLQYADFKQRKTDAHTDYIEQVI